MGFAVAYLLGFGMLDLIVKRYAHENFFYSLLYIASGFYRVII